ncbi:hypothetical protein [Raineyella sp. LH-20]|uniref:hypothetical protein n=1 Tax=Raineyella sp. LH-20 TaxID=3081204 RepID=UPI0029558F2E|nr:hypothetical protein [Raineyella sp. LH-20]WOP17617.1 hypothetical protein R0146_10095 [Raineyella sp. LH-20]
MHAGSARDRGRWALVVGALALGAVSITLAPAPVIPGRDRTVAPFLARTDPRPMTTRRLPDGTTVACAAGADCAVWAAAMTRAEEALDPLLPARPPVGDVTVVAPTSVVQAALLGVAMTARPAATTLMVDDDLVARGFAPADQRGRTWIVVNPDIARAGGDLPTQVLTHELVHARTRAPELTGPLWVEEGYAVALTHRALGPQAGPVRPPSAAGDWPSDRWPPRTTDDYGVAGQIVTDLAARIGWDGVARWYAASEAGAGSLAAAGAELTRPDGPAMRG